MHSRCNKAGYLHYTRPKPFALHREIDAYDDFEIEPVANVDNKMNVTNELLECSREYLHMW